MTELQSTLSQLEIVISETDGGFTAATYSEPFFCFVRNDLDELYQVVEDTLESYIVKFHKVKNAEVEFVDQPSTRQIPERRARAIRRIAPKIGESELACA